MKFNPTHHNLCVNTILLDKYLDAQDFREEATEYVYKKIVFMFKDQLEEAECKEDIYDDLIFETQCFIDYDSFDADAHEVVKQILSDFDIKDAV